MKKGFILIILTACGGCKKDGQASNLPVQPPAEKKWVVITVAGDGTAALANGPAAAARFHFPEDVVVTPGGSLYVTDVVNTLVRKIAAGQVSSFAGNGPGIVNGNGAAAKFNSPYSITADAAGNLYISDENDPRIRKITPSADVTTYAGSATEGFADGDADTSKFYPGNSIVADPQGNVYVADARNNRIRKISVSGKVSTIAGSGTGGFKEGDAASAQFGSPGAIALDKNGNLYIADRRNHRIREITTGGDVFTTAGSGTKGDKDGTASEAQFSDDMHDLVVDAEGNIYLEDENRLRKITPQGIVSTIAGSTAGFADGDGLFAKFSYLAGMSIDTQGNLYVADLNNNRIRKISFQ